MAPSAARTGMTLAGAAVTFAILQSATRRGESSPALYTIYALGDLALHMMCVQAVSFGAEMGLKRYVTAQRLTPPSMDSLPAQGPPAPPVKGWRKVLEVTQSVLMLAVPCLPGLCFHLIEKYLQYQVLIDGLNIVFWMGMLWFLTASALHVLYWAPALELRLEPSTVRKGWRLADNVKDSTRLKLAALGIAAAALGLSFVGFPKVGFVAGVSWVAAMLSTLSFQRLKMRSIILTLSLIFVCVPIVVIGVTALTGKSDDMGTDPAGEKQKKSIMLPSPWIVNVMEMWMVWPPYLFSGIFIAIGLRHDCIEHGSSAAIALKGEPGEYVAVPKTIDHLFEATQADGSIIALPKPAYRAGMTTLISTPLALKVYIAIKGIKGKEKAELECYLLGTAVLVALAILARKWQVGQLASWLNHSEIWVPRAPDAEAVQDVDDVEKTLWDEKAVGNGVSAPTETETAVVAVA